MKIVGELKYKFVKKIVETFNHVLVYPDKNTNYYFPIGTLEKKYYLNIAPSFAMSIIQPKGGCLIPYLVLESAYNNGLLDRKRIDKYFKSMLIDSGVSKTKAHVIYLLIRLFSGKCYKSN